ncbi:hypothetical protein [Sphingobacterium arenae]|uniref:Uncharacterized protein n=1 Tax=Sphingobacterium arenae TaxID=1280598 RepID=A0ABR7XY77_9SPHI|nr:hypothetical protein [Sphingobacterium arenae]MBD1424014.1 hypothetical protein [Sphingobacterium arenae]
MAGKTGTKRPCDHSSCQQPGLPLRTFSNSVSHLGKPTPGRPSSNKLGSGRMRQRATQAVDPITRGLQRRINPVTWLFSTASCNLRDCTKSISCNSATTVVRPVHLSASSVAHRTSRSFAMSTKTTRSGTTPNAWIEGGNSSRDVLIQRQTPSPTVSRETNPPINPLVAALSSLDILINSWTPKEGNTAFGNASSTGPRPTRSVVLTSGRVTPCHRSSSCFNRFTVSRLFSFSISIAAELGHQN